MTVNTNVAIGSLVPGQTARTADGDVLVVDGGSPGYVQVARFTDGHLFSLPIDREVEELNLKAVPA